MLKICGNQKTQVTLRQRSNHQQAMMIGEAIQLTRLVVGFRVVPWSSPTPATHGQRLIVFPFLSIPILPRPVLLPLPTPLPLSPRIFPPKALSGIPCLEIILLLHIPIKYSSPIALPSSKMGLLLTGNVFLRVPFEDKQVQRPLGLPGLHSGGFRFLKPHEVQPVKTGMFTPGILAGTFGGHFVKPQVCKHLPSNVPLTWGCHYPALEWILVDLRVH